MAEQTVILEPSESRIVSFEVVPHEARTYQVSVDGLSGSFRAIAPEKPDYLNGALVGDILYYHSDGTWQLRWWQRG